MPGKADSFFFPVFSRSICATSWRRAHLLPHVVCSCRLLTLATSGSVLAPGASPALLYVRLAAARCRGLRVSAAVHGPTPPFLATSRARLPRCSRVVARRVGCARPLAARRGSAAVRARAAAGPCRRSARRRSGSSGRCSPRAAPAAHRRPPPRAPAVARRGASPRPPAAAARRARGRARPPRRRPARNRESAALYGFFCCCCLHVTTVWYKLALWRFPLEDADAADRVEMTAFAAAEFVPRNNTIRAGLEDVVNKHLPVLVNETGSRRVGHLWKIGSGWTARRDAAHRWSGKPGFAEEVRPLGRSS